MLIVLGLQICPDRSLHATCAHEIPVTAADHGRTRRFRSSSPPRCAVPIRPWIAPNLERADCLTSTRGSPEFDDREEETRYALIRPTRQLVAPGLVVLGVLSCEVQ